MFWEVIQNSWRAALEVAILTVAIYYVFNFLRGTRGAPVVYGFLLVILSLTFFTLVLKLEVLFQLLRAFFAFSAVALIVIFQPELRRILAELGNLPLLNTTRAQRENIEVIIETVERLSEMRFGSLIAIEQTIQLPEVVGSGVVVNCDATPEILETIFFPNNALHDGGVIMKGDRISMAACIFPLTQRQDLSTSLGTRHRAAIGLTEETDAVVVVVSEETGSISHAYKGQLVRGVTLEKLRAFLTSVLVKRTRPRTFIDTVRGWKGGRFGRRGSAQPAAASVPAAPQPETGVAASAAKLDT